MKVTLEKVHFVKKIVKSVRFDINVNNFIMQFPGKVKMGIISSKSAENAEQINVQMTENIADQTLVSIGSGASGSSISPFQRLKNLSLSNRYERFSAKSGKPQSLSMNNLEGELTPRKTPNSGLKQRLIKALGGYNLLDPRSPSQLIARTPLAFGKQKESIENVGLGKKNLVLETSIDSRNGEVDENQDENPYSIFEENLDDEPEIEEEATIEQKHSSPSTIEVSVDAFDGLVISKDPRSPSDGIARTPLTFALGTLQTPSIEMQQSFTQEVQIQEKIPIKSETVETKQEKSSTQTLIKSIYKDLVRRDPIHRNLLHEDENEADLSRTTPIKKTTETKDRTPLSCVANKNRTKKTMQPKNLLGNVFEDNFSPKIEPTMIGSGDENTPIQVGTNEQKLGRMTTSSVSKSKSKIPVIRSRRLH